MDTSHRTLHPHAPRNDLVDEPVGLARPALQPTCADLRAVSEHLRQNGFRSAVRGRRLRISSYDPARDPNAPFGALYSGDQILRIWLDPEYGWVASEDDGLREHLAAGALVGIPRDVSTEGLCSAALADARGCWQWEAIPE